MLPVRRSHVPRLRRPAHTHCHPHKWRSCRDARQRPRDPRAAGDGGGPDTGRSEGLGWRARQAEAGWTGQGNRGSAQPGPSSGSITLRWQTWPRSPVALLTPVGAQGVPLAFSFGCSTLFSCVPFGPTEKSGFRLGDPRPCQATLPDHLPCPAWHRPVLSVHPPIPLQSVPPPPRHSPREGGARQETEESRLDMAA